MGLLTHIEHRCEDLPERFSVLTLNLAWDVGAAWDSLDLEQREIVYSRIVGIILAEATNTL